jgi:4-amino-4-deoxy-L-arabinose transferase-like glycosyltransferase
VVTANITGHLGRASRTAGWSARDTRRLAFVVIAALALYTYGLGVGTLWDRDETTYFQIARELRWADPFDLRLDGQPWFVHPPLFFWIQAATAGWLGFTEFAARLWSAVSGAAIVGATFLLARLLYGSGTALLAAAVAGTMLQVLAQARLAVFDPTLVAFMLLALYMGLVAYAAGKPRAYLWAFLWAGLATATKGPIGLIFPAATVVALWIARRDWRAWQAIPLMGPAIFAVVGLSWYIMGVIRHGTPFMSTAVGYYLFARFFGVVENQPGPWWYYIPVLVLGALPWTAFAPPAIAVLMSRRRELASQVILLWCGLTVAFYSLAGTKLPNYVLPVYPLLAIAIARLLADALQRPAAEAGRVLRWAAWLLPVPSVLFVAGMIIYGRLKFAAETAALAGPLAIAAGLLAGGPMAAWGLLLSRRVGAAVGALLLVPALAVPVLVHHTLPAVEAFRPIPRVAGLLREEMAPADALVAVRMPNAPSLRFYSGHRVMQVEDRHGLEQVLCASERIFVVTPVGEDAWVRPVLPPEAELRVEDAGLRLYVMAGAASCTRAPAPPR